MAKTTRLTGSLFVTAVIAGTVALAVLVNMLSGTVFGRLDLTENHLNTLSDASKEAAAALEDLDVTVYISPDLPETVRDDMGRERVSRAVVQAFQDKLEEYRSYASGSMNVRYETEDIVERGKKAKLQAFAGEEATAKGGRLEFKQYVVGATFDYHGVSEVFPLAVNPDLYEFEITRLLLRLRTKVEKSLLMKDVLAAGEAVKEAVAGCDAAVAKAEPEEDAAPDNPFGLMSKEASAAREAGYRDAAPAITQACAGVAGAVAAARELEGKHGALDELLLMAGAFEQVFAPFGESLSKPADQPAQPNPFGGGQGGPLALASQVHAVAAEVEREHDNLVDSPGRKSIGFVCAGKAFCPFPDGTPLIPKELEGVVGQKNPFAQQVVGQLQQITERINTVLSNVERNLFKRRGFDIVQVNLDEEVPHDVESLVVFGPKERLTDWQLYQLDQFVLKGGSLVVMLNEWDVSLMNFSATGEMNHTELKKNGSNIGDLLAHWGVGTRHDLVVEPESHDSVTVLQLIRAGGFTMQGRRNYRYPLVPVLTEFDTSSPLVRSVATLSLPWVSSLEIKDAPGRTITPLVRSSSTAATTTDPAFPLEPGAQLAKTATMAGDGPHVLAATVTGELASYFAGKDAPAAPQKGAEEPAKPEGLPEKARLDKGEGRVLVIGSNLGLEDLSRASILPDFNLGALTESNFEIIDQAKGWVANLQNWEIRLSQIQHTLQDNIQFMFNVLDWSIQQEALVEIRSKQYTRRPLAPLEDGEQAMVKVAAVTLAPLVFILLGVVGWAVRRRRRRQLIEFVRAAAAAQGGKA